MDPIVVNHASDADLEGVARLFDLYRQFYAQASDFALARRYIKSRMEKSESIILVARAASGELLGFCQLYPSFCSVIAAPIFSLYDLFVPAEKRRLGVGKLLLVAAENLAKEREVARLDLTTAKSNLPAQALYESLGWEQDQVFIAYSKHVEN